jgi:hypothetical protein
MEDWKKHARTFEDMAAYRELDGPLMDSTQAAIETQWVGYASVSDNFFSVLGRSAARGRVFQQDDFADDRHVAVIGHSLWRERFGDIAGAIGKRMNVGGIDVEVVGVMPEGFWFPNKDVQLWMPATLNPLWQRSRGDRGTRFGAVFGRLAPAVTIEQARARLRVVAAQLREQYPDSNGQSRRQSGAVAGAGARQERAVHARDAVWRGAVRLADRMCERREPAAGPWRGAPA